MRATDLRAAHVAPSRRARRTWNRTWNRTLGPDICQGGVAMQQTPRQLCEVCFEFVRIAPILPCGHTSCMACREKWVSERLDVGVHRIYCTGQNCQYVLMPYDISDAKLRQAFWRTYAQRLKCSMWFVRAFHNCFAPVYENTDERKSRIVMTKCRRCSDCNRPIDKISGCRHMTCVCGYEFCWKCNEKWAAGHVCRRLAYVDS